MIQLANLHGWRVAHFRGVRILRKNGTVYYQTPVQAQGAGFPDLLLVKRQTVAIELKVGSNTTSEEQKAWLEAFRRSGIAAYVIRPDDWEFLTRILKGEWEKK